MPVSTCTCICIVTICVARDHIPTSFCSFRCYSTAGSQAATEELVVLTSSVSHMSPRKRNKPTVMTRLFYFVPYTAPFLNNATRDTASARRVMEFCAPDVHHRRVSHSGVIYNVARQSITIISTAYFWCSKTFPRLCQKCTKILKKISFALFLRGFHSACGCLSTATPYGDSVVLALHASIRVFSATSTCSSCVVAFVLHFKCLEQPFAALKFQ